MSFQVSSVKEYFDTLPQRFVVGASKGINAVFQFEIAGDDGGTYHVTIKDEAMTVTEGAAAAPNVTIKMAAENYVKMVNGKLAGPMAFMKGLLKVTGNVMLAQKMQAVLPPAK